jgi:hypothetical protein
MYFTDVIYITFGVIASCVTGLSLPVIYIISGAIMNALNEESSNMKEHVSHLSLQLACVGFACLVSGTIQV